MLLLTESNGFRDPLPSGALFHAGPRPGSVMLNKLPAESILCLHFIDKGGRFLTQANDLIGGIKYAI
jgi:hypothetical protein